MFFPSRLLFALALSTVATKVVQSQFLCVVSCAPNANSVAILDTVQQCCATGGVGGYYPLLVGKSFEDCMECTNFESFQPNLNINVDPNPVNLNQDAVFTCNISSTDPSIEVEGTIQWLSADNTVLQQSGPNSDSLELNFQPFQQSDIGDYTCTAQVSSPDLPSGLMTFLSRTLFYSPPQSQVPTTNVTVSESVAPIAGNPYTLSATVSMEGETIEWIGPNGTTLTSGDGIIVGNIINGGGVTARTLTFTNLRSSDTGIYTASTSSGDIIVRLITNFPVPDTTITTTQPQFNQPFQPECAGSLPSALEGATLTVSWIAPDGSEVASQSTMDQSASVDLPINSLGASNLGTYICQVLITSPFLDRSIVAMSDLTVFVPGATTQEPSTTIPGGTTTSGPGMPDTTSSVGSEPDTTDNLGTGTGATTVTSTPETTVTSVSADVNECELGTDNCSRQRFCAVSLLNGYYRITCAPIATCTDAVDGFECNCANGFEGDGVICSDINECSLGVDDCHPEASCLNRRGGYVCRCRPGYIGDGVGCCIRKKHVKNYLESTRSKTKKRSKRRQGKNTKNGTGRRSKGKSDSESEMAELDSECQAVLEAYSSSSGSIQTSRHSGSRHRGSRHRGSRHSGPRHRSHHHSKTHRRSH